METIYEHAGGPDALRHFIDVFYGSVLADPMLQPLFGAGRPDHVDHLPRSRPSRSAGRTTLPSSSASPISSTCTAA